MSIGIPQLIFAFVVIYFILWVYTARKRERQIFVTYRREDNNIVEQFVDIRDRWVFFDRKKFEIIPDCIRYLKWRRGLFFIVGISVATLEYTWNSDLPIDPDTGKVYNILSPAVRNAMNQEEWMLASQRASEKYRKAEKRESFLQKYGAYITIGLVVVLGVYMWMQIRGLDASISTLAEYYKSLIK